MYPIPNFAQYFSVILCSYHTNVSVRQYQLSKQTN